jgi:zinc transporter ZupT
MNERTIFAGIASAIVAFGLADYIDTLEAIAFGVAAGLLVYAAYQEPNE